MRRIPRECQWIDDEVRRVNPWDFLKKSVNSDRKVKHPDPAVAGKPKVSSG
jgi:hypothetical protein